MFMRNLQFRLQLLRREEHRFVQLELGFVALQLEARRLVPMVGRGIGLRLPLDKLLVVVPSKALGILPVVLAVAQLKMPKLIIMNLNFTAHRKKLPSNKHY
jgi:hypothetical protein